MEVATFLTTFGAGLLAISLFTSLTTQAIKGFTKDKWPDNVVASIVSVVLSIALCVGYVIVTGTAVTPAFIVFGVLLMFLGWLCACVGYDKVKQAIQQIIKSTGK